MIKAGKLDRQITIERQTETIAPSGAVSKAWTVIATIRAEVLQIGAQEALTSFGAADGGKAVFRIRYLPGITTADRVVCGGVIFDLDTITEIGRRRGLELHCSRGAT